MKLPAWEVRENGVVERNKRSTSQATTRTASAEAGVSPIPVGNHSIAEGKSARDATRILKRYLARLLYRVMQNASPTMT